MYRSALTLLLLSCAAPPQSADTGPRPQGDAGLAAPPAPPADVVLTPCPDGWREIPGAPTVCDPWPEGGRRTDCAFDEAHFPGHPGCERIGSACAADGWPADLPTDRAIVHVDDGAASGGDGSRAHPFRTLGAAIAAAPPSAVIAIATGRYDEDVVVPSGLELRGACVDGTRLTSSRPGTDSDAVIFLEGAGAVRNVSIDGASRPGVLANGGPATIEDVVIDGARIGAILSGTAPNDVSVRHVALRRITASAGLGRGVDGSGGAGHHFVLDTVVIDRCADVGVFINRGGALEASDLAVVDCTGIDAANLAVGVLAETTGTRAVISRAVFEGNHGDALGAASGATLEASDVVARDGRADTSDGLGAGAQTGASVRLTRARLEHLGLGLGVAGAGSRLEGSDILIRDLAGTGAYEGLGAVAKSAGALILRRAWVARAVLVAIAGTDPGTTVDVEDLTVAGVTSSPAGPAAMAFIVQAGATGTLSRASVSRLVRQAIYAYQGSALTLTDVRVADVTGPAITSEQNSTLTASRIAILGARLVGLGALNGGSLSASDVTIEGVDAYCEDPGCAAPAGGHALAGYHGAALTVTRFETSHAAICGVLVGDDTASTHTSVDLFEGTVRDVPIGACIQVDAYDPERLHHDVRFVDVMVPLQATSYGLPSSVGMLSL